MGELTLFLVDDYPLARVSNKIQLEHNPDFKIIGDYTNMKDCLKALEEKQPDIILLDIELPDINGVEACKIIKEKYPEIKIVILTLNDENINILASLSCGVNAYIVKGSGDVAKILKIVAQGGFWISSELAHSAFSKIPIPDFKNMEDIHKYQKINQMLTARELEVLKLIIEGKTNSQIAQEIVVSTNTAKAHVGKILEKFGVKDRVQAAVMAVRANLF